MFYEFGIEIEISSLPRRAIPIQAYMLSVLEEYLNLLEL
jgi:hypothetical protein